MTAKPYFPGEDRRLASLLDAYLGWLAEDSASVPGLRALMLGGGYGRGEGGVFTAAPGVGSELFNDLEFYLFAESSPRALMNRWVHEGEQRVGLEIEIKAMAPSRFAQARPSMFFYDLLNGHVHVAGDASWVASLPADLSRAEAIPPDEAGRLLVNRGMSLLRCLRWARGELPLPDGFCARITGKLKLALADAALCSEGRYHWSCRERNKRLSAVAEAPPDWDRMVAWHGEGVEFKLHPHRRDGEPGDQWTALDDLRRTWLSTFLWVESRRLGENFRTAEDYGNFRGKLFPAEKPWSNMLRRMRDLRRPQRTPFALGDHPRAAIWRSLALLLDGGSGAAAGAGRLLGVPDKTGLELEEHCRACWQHYP